MKITKEDLKSVAGGLVIGAAVLIALLTFGWTP
jgi:hypothetical protein